MKKNIKIILGVIILTTIVFIAYKFTPGQIETDIDMLVDVPSQSATLNTLADNTGAPTSETNESNSDQSKEASEENQENTMKATFNTSKGSFEIELFNDLAPKTVENFVKLAESNFYDEVKFHRVIKNFMIQAGDPLSKDDDMSDRWGTGGPGYSFEDEIHGENFNIRGTISMANAGPDTNGSQFFINTNPDDNSFLDGKHTVFGKIISGMDVVDSIENVEKFPNDRPVEAVIITSITINK
ncbi:MAG: cyclophilin family peptidyl-prolyl cis-trans isomerase [Crocinitomicaceae bacterium]|jgi:cyclophilin family peptidyl-prolyl cis-trans isomerase